MGFHMGYKFLSSLGLRLTGRTFVTKRNCTPDPQIGCCGKPFIFNSGHLPATFFQACRYAPLLSGSARCRDFSIHLRVTIPGNFCPTVPFHSSAELFSQRRRFIEDNAVMDTTCPSPSNCRKQEFMSDDAVITPAASAIGRPEPGEYAPYYDRYISLISGSDILGTLDSQRRQMLLLLSGRDESDGDFRYAPGKWTVKELLGHVCDTERMFAYRALRISRGDTTPIEGFDQDDYVRNGPFAHRPLAEVIEDYIAVRRATLTLFRNLDDVAWQRRGIANKNEVSVRAIAFTVAGHELHHRRILEEKYFAKS